MTDYIRTLGNKLVTNSPDNRQKFTFFVVQDNSINAFAMPGGVIGVHTGLMLAANSESELAILLIGAITSLVILILVFKMPNIGMPLLGGYILFYAAFSKTINASNFSKYGDFSYGLYLYAFPVQQLLVFYYGEHLNGLLMFTISLILTLVLAIISWYLVEKPFLKLKPRRIIQ